MKVGFLSHCDSNLYRFRLSLMKEFIERGHEVYAIAPREDKLDDFKQHGIKIIHWNVSRPSINPLSALRSTYELIQILRPLQLDILHTYMAKPNIMGNIAAKVLKIPYVINAITGLGSLYVENGIRVRILRKILELVSKVTYRFSDLVLFQNAESLECFVNKGILSSSKARLIKGSGVDLNYWQQEVPVARRTVKVLMVARLIKHKGVIEYLQAAEELMKRGLNIEFSLAGASDAGNPYAVYDKVFKDYHGVGYLGYIDDIKLELQKTDIFVYPSYYGEGIPRSLLEAAAMGKAIVTTDIPGCRDVVKNEESGLLIAPKDITALIFAIERLANDLTLRTRLGFAARKHVEEYFDEKRIISAHFKAYEKIGAIL